MFDYLIAMAPAGEGGEGAFTGTLIMFLLIIFIFYFLIIRPQQKRQKERQALLDSVKKGDKVVTVGGMHGEIVGIDEKTILLKVADNVKLKLDRSSVNSITKKSDE
jgi:preprotein translocase subunit YajC